MVAGSTVQKVTNKNTDCKDLFQAILSPCMTQHLFFFCPLIDIQTADGFTDDIKAPWLNF